jgi:hypothetical protein
VLETAGFVRRGRTFRLVGGKGDQAIIGIERTAGSRGDWVEFYVHAAVVPVPYWAWLQHVFPSVADREPEYSDGLWRHRVEAPANLRADAGPWTTDLWLLAGSAAVPACGSSLATILRTETIPLATSLLDRPTFLNLTRDPSNPLGTSLGPADLILLVDEGPSPELDQAIAHYKSLDPTDYPAAAALATWAESRASQ